MGTTQISHQPQDQAHLLQCGRAELDGNVVELLVPLSAEVADNMGMLVRLPQQPHLTVDKMEALGQEALHGHVPAIELSPAQGSMTVSMHSPAQPEQSPARVTWE